MSIVRFRTRFAPFARPLAAMPWRSRVPPSGAAGVLGAAVLTATAMVAALLAPSPALAEGTMRFEPIGGWDVEIDGKLQGEAELFASREAGAILLLTPEIPHPLALVPRNKTLQRLAQADLRREPAGSIAWSAQGERVAIGAFELPDNRPAFELGGRKYRFVDRKPLLGSRTIEEIVEYDPSYRYKSTLFEPTEHYMAVLENVEDPVLVKIFFSTQCQICRETLGNIVKVVEELDNPKLRFEFYGLPLPAVGDPVVEEVGLKTFPTGVVYIGGREVGRAEGYSWKHPDMAIHHVIAGIKVDPEKLITRQ